MTESRKFIGNERVASDLEGAVRRGTLPGATLLVGEESVGKSTLIRSILPIAIDESVYPGDPLSHPDVWWNDSEESFKIETVRGQKGETHGLLDFLAKSAYGKKLRVVGICHAGRMTDDAANSLLKVLEEPPPHTHFLLTVESLDGVPQTVASRSTVVRCRTVPITEIAAWLVESEGYDSALAERASRHSLGRPGRALSLARNPDSFEKIDASARLFFDLLSGGRLAALEAVDSLVGRGRQDARDDVRSVVTTFSDVLLDIAQCQQGGNPGVFVESGTEIRTLAGRMSVSVVADLLARSKAASDALSRYANAKLACDALFLECAGKGTSR